MVEHYPAEILEKIKIFDMICIDYFLLLKFHFFQFYFPEIEGVSHGRNVDVI